MRYGKLAVVLAFLIAAGSVLAAPGETSGAPLAPLLVTGYDKATGTLQLSYQSGCGTTDNTLYYGPLSQVATLGTSGNVCDVGTSGRVAGFNPGPGSSFFLIVGNDFPLEGSAGWSYNAGSLQPRPMLNNTCGLVHDLSQACVPPAVGGACTSSLECGVRGSCVTGVTGGGACACLPPYAGTHCQSCAPGYAGPDCRECAAGFVGNAMQNEDGGDLPADVTAPELFQCVPDVPGSCSGHTCGGRGACVVAGRDAICACEPGYSGSDCQDCAPSYERNATGACVLGAACRAAKCGGHGSCLPAAAGEVVCQCDAGYPAPDCGGAPLTIAAASETLTLYDTQSLVLKPQGGVGPYAWSLTAGPGRLENCVPRTDPTCPTGGARLTVVAPAGGIPDLTILHVSLTDGVGVQTAINLAALPPTYLPFTGAIKTELVPFYRAMLKYMRARGIRGGVLGISKGGTVLATNGYGYRDAGLDNDPFVNAGDPGPLVQPDAPFRIASVTKPLTAAAVRGAVADAGVNINSISPFDRAARWIGQSLGFNLVNGFVPFDYNLQTPNTPDPRWASMTIQHLLNHHVGFWRDSALPGLNGLPAYNAGKLPFTVNPDNPNDFQPALTGTGSDISYATSYLLAGLQLANDPRPTVERTILFTAGNTFQYNPGGAIGNGDNYANIGYILAGRVLEGLKGEPYDPDDPSVPEGWGKFPTLLQDYLCETSGITSGIYPGDTFHPYAGEPYYRDIDADGNEEWEWNMAGGSDRIRFNNQTLVWEFCQSGCGAPGAVWGTDANAPSPYGGIWLAQRNSAGGIVATTSALLKFARNHRVKVGTPGEGATGIGSLLAAPGAYGSSSRHNGSLPGTRSWLWQMGGVRNNRLPLDWGAWTSDPSMPLDLDEDGNVRIDEATVAASSCNLPSDVAVAVIFNQRQDRRAPGSGGVGNSTNSAVYGRIIDFLGDATCQVLAGEGWPAFGEAPAQLAVQPNCN